jgi:hypothetical protein
VKTGIFGDNNGRLYNIQYEKAGPEPSNTRYGYVVPNGPIDHGVFA